MSLDKRPSLRKCVNDHCKCCIFDPRAAGTWRQQVTLCSVTECYLFPVKPASKAPIPESVLDYYHVAEEKRVLYYWHSLGNKCLTILSNMCTNINLTDMETCYKVFRREVIDKLDIKSRRFGVEPEITAKIAKAGWRIYEVGISYSGRTYKEGKKITWKDGLVAIISIIRFNFF